LFLTANTDNIAMDSYRKQQMTSRTPNYRAHTSKHIK